VALGAWGTCSAERLQLVFVLVFQFSKPQIFLKVLMLLLTLEKCFGYSGKVGGVFLFVCLFFNAHNSRLLQNQSLQLNLYIENKISIVLTCVLIQYFCSFLVKILQVFGNWELKYLVYKPFNTYMLPQKILIADVN